MLCSLSEHYDLFVPPAPTPSFNKSEINRCGKRLAEVHNLRVTGPMAEWKAAIAEPEYERAMGIVDAFREAHQQPLGSASVSLRSFVATSLKQSPVVSQRLKRLPRIVRKLAHMGSSNLARLEDIGGTRAVVQTLEDQRKLCEHIERRWATSIVRHRDYVVDPKPSGYRAHHYVIQRNGCRIEVQVRTRVQQTWANAVEHAASRHGLSLKDGIGPQSMLDYFSATGAMLNYQEMGIAPPIGIHVAYEVASDAVVAEGFYSRRKVT